MAYLLSILLLTVLVSFSHFKLPCSAVNIRLSAVGNKIETRCYGKQLNASCSLHQRHSTVNQSIDCDIEVMREIKDLKLTVNYNVVALNGLAQTSLLKRTLDLCFFLRNPRSDRLISSIYTYIKQRSNLPPRCPLPVAHYTIRSLRLRDLPIPVFLPESDFVLEEIFRSEVKHETLFEFRFHGKLVRYIDTK